MIWYDDMIWRIFIYIKRYYDTVYGMIYGMVWYDVYDIMQTDTNVSVICATVTRAVLTDGQPVTTPTAPGAPAHSLLLTTPTAPGAPAHSLLLTTPTAPGAPAHSLLLTTPTAPGAPAHSPTCLHSSKRPPPATPRSVSFHSSHKRGLSYISSFFFPS